MKWTITDAQNHFGKLLQEAKHAPQSIYKHDHVIAAVLDAETFEAFQAWQRAQQHAIGEALQDIQTICEEENYVLDTRERRNRANPLT